MVAKRGVGRGGGTGVGGGLVEKKGGKVSRNEKGVDGVGEIFVDQRISSIFPLFKVL